MIRVTWTRTAVAQFPLIRETDLRLQVYSAVQGLRRFPQKGRQAPEIVAYPDLQFPGELREVVFPRLFRVFYLYEKRKQEITVMGVAFHGQDIDHEWVLKMLSD